MGYKSVVEYNLENKTYSFEVQQGNERFLFSFSSRLYRETFKNRITQNHVKISESLSKRFKFHIENITLSMLVSYMEVEKRGFYIEHGGSVYKCPEELTLSGGKLMPSDLVAPQENSMQK